MKSLRCDLNKTIINSGFIGAVFITCMLCFTAYAYIDGATSKTYSVFEALFTLDKDIIQTNSDFASIFIFRKAMSGYITMFLPIIVAFPFMVSFCAERNNGLMRFTITRIGKYKYYFSKFFASFISGGLAVLIGVAMFGLISVILFPELSSYNLTPDEMEGLLPEGVSISIIKTLISAFAYGAVSTLPAFMLSSFCKNPYLITCIPFLLTYIWNTTLEKLISKGIETGDFEIYDRLYPFYPNAVANLCYSSEFDLAAKKTILFNVVYLAVILIGFILIMNKRKDKGC
ncbi:MAG: hypothetical protein K2F81_01490 [Ruminococcus sp.]|nr:hypothetical protein [Ruminococcus sp.]